MVTRQGLVIIDAAAKSSRLTCSKLRLELGSDRSVAQNLRMYKVVRFRESEVPEILRTAAKNLAGSR